MYGNQGNGALGQSAKLGAVAGYASDMPTQAPKDPEVLRALSELERLLCDAHSRFDVLQARIDKVARQDPQEPAATLSPYAGVTQIGIWVSNLCCRASDLNDRISSQIDRLEI